MKTTMVDFVLEAENVRLSNDNRTLRHRILRLERFVERVAEHDYPILASQAKDLLHEEPAYKYRKEDAKRDGY